MRGKLGFVLSSLYILINTVNFTVWNSKWQSIVIKLTLNVNTTINNQSKTTYDMINC